MIHDIQSAFVKLYLIYFGIFWLKVILDKWFVRLLFNSSGYRGLISKVHYVSDIFKRAGFGRV